MNKLPLTTLMMGQQVPAQNQEDLSQALFSFLPAVEFGRDYEALEKQGWCYFRVFAGPAAGKHMMFRACLDPAEILSNKPRLPSYAVCS